MKRFRPLIHYLPAITVVALTTVTIACTTTTTQSFRTSSKYDPDAPYVAIATDADFSRYDKLLARDMGIYFPTDAAPSVEDQMRTREIFRKAFFSELSEYTIVREPSPGALDVQPTLIDYRSTSSGYVPGVRRDLSNLAKSGTIMFLMELKDPDTGKVLARAADNSATPSIATTADMVTDWAEVEDAANRWAKAFRQFLDQNLNKQPR